MNTKEFEQLNLSWEDFSNVDYCKDKCEFYKTCYGNHEVCPKQAFKDMLETLDEREQVILKLRFGFCNNKELSWEEIADYLNLTKNYVKQLSQKPIRKLRHPLRFKVLRERKYDFYSANTDFYRNLFKELIGQEDNETLVEIKLGLDYSIIDREKSFNKSIATIKKELDTKLSDICELKQYFSALAKQNIYTLKELLYSSIEKILKSFENNDELLFSLHNKLINMGYRIKTTHYKSEREYFNDYYLEFVSFNLFPNIENQDLIDSQLPSGIVVKLLERHISTINELFQLSKSEIETIIDDDKKTEQLLSFVELNKPTISLGKYNIHNIYINSFFITCFYWNLFEELHKNAYSVNALHSKIKDLRITSFERLTYCIEKDFSRISIKKLFNITVMLNNPIEEINLSNRACGILHHSGIYTIHDLISKTKEGLYKLKPLGIKTFNEIIEKLHAHGLKLKDEE